MLSSVGGGGGGASLSVLVEVCTESIKHQKENVPNMYWPTTVMLAGAKKTHSSPKLFHWGPWPPVPLFIYLFIIYTPLYSKVQIGRSAKNNAGWRHLHHACISFVSVCVFSDVYVGFIEPAMCNLCEIGLSIFHYNLHSSWVEINVHSLKKRY